MNKQDFLQALRTRKERVEKVESQLGTLYVRSMRGWQLTEFQLNSSDKNYPTRGKAIAYTLCDEQGNEIGFSDAEVEEFNNAPTEVTEPIVDAALRISGVRQTPAEADKTAKN